MGNSVIRQASTFLEMIKFSHTVFALPFALMSACLASARVGGWRLLDLVGILTCMVMARTAAMAFNRWCDADFDANNPRTAMRAIPAGALSSRAVLLATILAGVGFQLAAGIFYLSSGNIWPSVLAMPVLAFLLLYSMAKRWTQYVHWWLGIALGLSPICAWLAITGRIDLPPVLLGLAIAFWVAGFDILYALQDFEFDRGVGLKSIPARLGPTTARVIAITSHLVMLGLLAGFVIVTPELGPASWMGYACTVGIVCFQHFVLRKAELAKINLAFFNANATISLLMFIAVAIDLYVLGKTA